MRPIPLECSNDQEALKAAQKIADELYLKVKLHKPLKLFVTDEEGVVVGEIRVPRLHG